MSAKIISLPFPCRPPVADPHQRERAYILECLIRLIGSLDDPKYDPAIDLVIDYIGERLSQYAELRRGIR